MLTLNPSVIDALPIPSELIPYGINYILLVNEKSLAWLRGVVSIDTVLYLSLNLRARMPTGGVH